MAFATKAQLSSYTGTPEVDLPSDSPRLLDRATELVRHAVIMPNVFDDAGDPESDLDTYQVEALQDATCAQVEYWIETGEHIDIDGSVQSFQLGDLQVTYGAGSNRVAPTVLAPRARRHLFEGGLGQRGAMVG